MRTSHESNAVTFLREAAGASTPVFSGQDRANSFDVPEWNIARRFQFGDLRVELPQTTVVVEVESGRGIGNLVKYWPLLKSGVLEKKFLLIHVYQIASADDYITHRRLWEFVVERMRTDLACLPLQWHEDWEARLFTYPAGEDPRDAAAYLRQAVPTGSIKRDLEEQA